MLVLAFSGKWLLNYRKSKVYLIWLVPVE